MRTESQRKQGGGDRSFVGGGMGVLTEVAGNVAKIYRLLGFPI